MTKLFYRSFGLEPEGNTNPGLPVLAFGFVVVSLALLAFLNFFTLMFGITVNHLGRDGVRFGFLKLFGKLPAVAIAMPLLFGYAVWYQAMRDGFLAAVAPVVLTALAAFLLLGLCGVYGYLRSR